MIFGIRHSWTFSGKDVNITTFFLPLLTTCPSQLSGLMRLTRFFKANGMTYYQIRRKSIKLWMNTELLRWAKGEAGWVNAVQDVVSFGEDLTKPPTGLIQETWDDVLPQGKTWDDLTKPQQLALRNLSQEPVPLSFQPSTIDDILNETGSWYAGALDDIAVLTKPIDDVVDVVPVSTIDDSLPVNHPDNMLVSDVDAQMANLYNIIPVADDSIESVADGLNKLSLKAGPYKNSPHRLQFIDELAIMIIQEGNLSTVPAWLKQISLPPGMKKLDKKVLWMPDGG